MKTPAVTQWFYGRPKWVGVYETRRMLSEDHEIYYRFYDGVQWGLAALTPRASYKYLGTLDVPQRLWFRGLADKP